MKLTRWLALVSVSLFLSLPRHSTHAEDAIVGVASVIDGDTIEVHGIRIRLSGIDAPESRQECIRSDATNWRCGQEAAFELSNRIGTNPIRCEPQGRDRYRRTIATCYDRGEDLNRWMVLNGWAVAYRKYSVVYVPDEDRARGDKRGIWVSTFEMPWDFRSRGR